MELFGKFLEHHDACLLDDVGIRDVDHKTRQQKKRTIKMKKKHEKYYWAVRRTQTKMRILGALNACIERLSSLPRSIPVEHDPNGTRRNADKAAVTPIMAFEVVTNIKDD